MKEELLFVKRDCGGRDKEYGRIENGYSRVPSQM